jgi:tol-pal system protein YbgF
MKSKLIVCAAVFALSSVVMFSSFADAPVEDASTQFQATASTPATDKKEAPVASKSGEKTGHEIKDQAVVGATSSHDEKDADHPQVSADQVDKDQASEPVKLNLSQEQRIAKLEKQVNNIASMNFPQQITLLQQQIAQLRGQLEVQGHDLQLLNKQVRSFYQDLDNRINQMNNLNGGDSGKVDNNVLKASTSIQLQDANAYQAAFSLLTKHQYNKAQKAFLNYINDYPNGNYVADAHYWLGEIYLTQKNYKKSESAFQTVLLKYPKSDKISDAKLKIAIIHANTGKVDQAKGELRDIQKKHPNSTAAQLANIHLQQLEQGDQLNP